MYAFLLKQTTDNSNEKIDKIYLSLLVGTEESIYGGILYVRTGQNDREMKGEERTVWKPFCQPCISKTEKVLSMNPIHEVFVETVV